jgi:hypothetical protein
VSSEDGDGGVLTSCASQNMVFGCSEALVGGLRDREVLRGRSTRGRVRVVERVRPVPDAGELQANVSLAHADKSVADGSTLSRATIG